jgi:hypothetical protein
MIRRNTIIIAGCVLLTAGGIAIAGGVAANHSDDERPITGDALRRASEAAIAHTRGGVVSETEVGDEDSLYEVEVTLDDGSQVDVQLDENFRVVSSEADDDSGPDDG